MTHEQKQDHRIKHLEEVVRALIKELEDAGVIDKGVVALIGGGGGEED